jgi:hypothetical protein
VELGTRSGSSKNILVLDLKLDLVLVWFLVTWTKNGS